MISPAPSRAGGHSIEPQPQHTGKLEAAGPARWGLQLDAQAVQAALLGELDQSIEAGPGLHRLALGAHRDQPRRRPADANAQLLAAAVIRGPAGHGVAHLAGAGQHPQGVDIDGLADHPLPSCCRTCRRTAAVSTTS